ncbi:hypothetical protein Tco_1516629 [Tanacetum coccineum]
MKDHPLEQVIGNPSQSIRIRRQLETDGEMCKFALTVSQTELKNIKEAMADSAWIEAMQEELHQFDRLDVWELVDRPLCKNVINMKWLWKNKRDEENTIIRNKARLVAKGYNMLNKEPNGFVDPYHIPDKFTVSRMHYMVSNSNKSSVLWLRLQLTDYGFYFDKIPVYCDSKAAIAISCNLVQHSRTKHIDVRYHFIKEHVEKGIVELFFVRTEYQLAGLFIKALSEDRFKYLVRQLGMRYLTPDELEVLANESA